MKQRAVGYVRVSTEEQVDGLSLDGQRHEIADYCDRHGYELLTFYADEGVSAYTEEIGKRPEFSRMLSDATRGGFDIVVVRDLSRFARRTSVQNTALERLGRANVGFVSLKENLDFTSPSGKLMLTMLGGVNEFQSAQTGLNVAAAHAERARRGLPPGPVPFGYVVPEAGGAPVVEPSEARAVVDAFNQRLACRTYPEIAEMLNSRGFRTRKGRLFNYFSVRDMLTQRFYLGVVRHKGVEYPGQHPAIVPADLFNRVQAKRLTGHTPKQAPVTKGALAGRVRCIRCTRSLWSDRTPSGNSRYREQHGQPCVTAGLSVSAKRIDEQVGLIFGSIELESEWVEGALATPEDGGIELLQERKRRLARAYGDGAYTDAEYTARMAELDARIRAFSPPLEPEIEQVAALLNDLPTLWSEATPQERRQLLAPILERVYIDVQTKQVGAISPTAPFRTMLQKAVRMLPVSLVPPAQGVGCGGDGGVPTPTAPTDPILPPYEWPIFWKEGVVVGIGNSRFLHHLR